VIIALGDVYAQIPRRDEVRELMRVTQRRVAEQPGCLSFAFAETLEDPAHFLIVERWRDQQALDEHYRSEAFAEYQAGIANWLVRASELRVHVVQERYVPVDSQSIETPHED
jgi:quinol monooxygenase YgiN